MNRTPLLCCDAAVQVLSDHWSLVRLHMHVLMVMMQPLSLSFQKLQRVHACAIRTPHYHRHRALTTLAAKMTGASHDQGIPEALLSSAYKHELEIALQAAQDAGRVIAAAFRQPKSISEKANEADLVTETDKHAEELIMGRIRAAFPDHQFIGEEQTAAQGYTSALTDEPTWMCDPLDGTTNFVHSFPWVCVSLALAVSAAGACCCLPACALCGRAMQGDNERQAPQVERGWASLTMCANAGC